MIRFNIINHIPLGGRTTASQVAGRGLSKRKYYQLFALLYTYKSGSPLYIDDFERHVAIFSRWPVS